MARPSVSLALLLLLTLSAGGAAQAAPLPPEVCDQLKTELASLTASGVPQQLEQSPKAASRQLTVEQRSDITRYIKVEQQVLFRCPRPPAPPDPLGGLAVAIDPNEQGEVTDGSDIVLPRGVAAAAKPVPKKVKAADGTAVKAAAKPATKTAAVDGAAAPKPKPAAAKPPAPPAAKPKPADAFVPAKPAQSQ